MKNSVGLIGVGTMGRVILDTLIEHGVDVMATDSAQSSQQYIAGSSADMLPDPGSVVRICDITILSLPAPRNIDEVVFMKRGVLEAAAPGKIVIDTSTVDPETSKKAAAALKEKGTDYLDAPILGRPSSIGNWILPIGGDHDAFIRSQPILTYFTKQVVYAGPSGSGNAFKLLNQLMFSTINAITAEVFAIAERAGVNTELFYSTVAESGAATVSGLFKECGKKIVNNRFDPVFPIDMLIKDAGLGIEMARRLGTPSMIASFVQVLNETARGKGYGALDTSALVKVYNDLYRADAGNDFTRGDL